MNHAATCSDAAPVRGRCPRDGIIGAGKLRESSNVMNFEIIDNDYDLSINKYKEIEYERVGCPPTSEILDELDDLNRQMTEGLASLRAMLADGAAEGGDGE